MNGFDMNSALAFWVLTRVVVPACGLLVVFVLVDEFNDWWNRR